MIKAGQLRHRIALHTPTNVPDGDGGYTETWTALTPPELWAAIQPATATTLERLVANTVESTATHVVTIRYHDGITPTTRITHRGRYLFVRDLVNVDEVGDSMLLACEEVVPAVVPA